MAANQMVAALIGNSHAIAIRDALKAGAANSFNISHVHLIQGNWRIVEVEAVGRLRHRIIGDPSIESEPITFFDEISSILLSAVGWGAARNHFIDAEHPVHPLGHMACVDWSSPPNLPGKVGFVSIAVFRHAVEAWMRQHPIFQLAQRAVELCSGPIFLQPWPAPSRALKNDPQWVLNRWYGDRGKCAWLAFFNAQLAAMRKFACELGDRVVLLDYPIDDVYNDGFMDPAWCHPRDPFHANKDYGSLVLNRLVNLNRSIGSRDS